MKAMLNCEAQVNFYPQSSHLWTDFGEIRYNRSEYNYVGRL
jgi:hypothetical protein